jgi:hypothetical protein
MSPCHVTVHVAHVVHQAMEPGEEFGHSLHACHARERAVVSRLDTPQPCHHYSQESKLTRSNQPNQKHANESILTRRTCAHAGVIHRALCQRDSAVGGVGRHRDGGEVVGGALARVERVRGASAAALQAVDHGLAVGPETAGQGSRTGSGVGAAACWLYGTCGRRWASRLDERAGEVDNERHAVRFLITEMV